MESEGPGCKLSLRKVPRVTAAMSVQDDATEERMRTQHAKVYGSSCAVLVRSYAT